MRKQPGHMAPLQFVRLGRRWHSLSIVVVMLAACTSQSSVDQHDLEKVVGSWVGRQVLDYERPDSVVILFSIRSDSSLQLSLTYEVGPRARLWSHDIDVTYRDGKVEWDYHRGRVNPGRDTMWVSKNYRGDKSEWLYIRDRGADSLAERLRFHADAPHEYRAPRAIEDGWESGEPAAVGLDQETLTRFLDEIADGEFGDIHSVVIARYNTIVVEEYFAGQGKKHGALIASVFGNRVHHLASVTKSLSSVLVGIAIDQGFITSVEDPISRYLPEYASLLVGEKESITIQHLLTMSSGLAWRQSGVRWSSSRNDAAAMWRCEDVVGCVLQKRLDAAPGSRFLYSNGSAVVVGAILRNATGMEVGQFAEEYLFRPLGIADYLWTSYPDGAIETDGGLALRPRDLAKIGQTLLDNGRWRGVSVVSEEWVEQSTKRRFVFGSAGGARLGYGYFWMQTSVVTDDMTTQTYFHPGDGGQLLMVIPDHEMVVVFTAGTYGTNVTSTYLPIMEESILEAVASGSAE